MTSQPQSNAAACFSVPRAVINTLIDAHADAVTIGAYLTLAAHTDKTGQFSTAGLKAIRENLGIDKPRAEKAVDTLTKLRAAPRPADTDAPTRPSSKKKMTLVPSAPPSSPLVYPRTRWLAEGHPPPPGPESPQGRVPREDPRLVRFVLPTFDEVPQDRVWIDAALVRGDTLMERPLYALKNCGSVAARLLLALYMGQDLSRWYGIPPCCGNFFEHQYRHYTGYLDEGHSVLLVQPLTISGNTPLFNRLTLSMTDRPTKEERTKEEQTKKHELVWQALRALQSDGFLYEVVCLLNRHPRNLTQEKLQGDDASYHGSIDQEADLLCDLAYHGIGGPVSSVEVPFYNWYRQTAIDFGYKFYDTRRNWPLALVTNGAPAMVAGFYRLRYRVRNPRNAFIEDTDQAQLDRATAELNKLNYRRKMKGLDSIKGPNPTLQSSSIPLQSSSMHFNAVQSPAHGEGSCERGTPIEEELTGSNALPLGGKR